MISVVAVVVVVVDSIAEVDGGEKEDAGGGLGFEVVG